MRLCMAELGRKRTGGFWRGTPKVWKKTKAGLSRIRNWSFGVALDLAKAFALSEARKLGLPLPA